MTRLLGTVRVGKPFIGGPVVREVIKAGFWLVVLVFVALAVGVVVS